MTLTSSDTAFRRLVLLRSPLTVALTMAGAFVLVALVDPHEPGHYPVCPVLALSGFACPLCGGLRAANALAHGDPASAVGSNVLVVAGIVVAVVLWARWTVLRLRGRPAPLVNPSNHALVASLVVLFGFGVLRNLPFGAFLGP